MELEGIVRNGVIVPDRPEVLAEGTRVRLVIMPTEAATFAERYAAFEGAAEGLPEDLAAQHEHYRLGMPRQ